MNASTAIWTPDGRLIRGNWKNVMIFENQEHKKAFQAGALNAYPLWGADFPNGITNGGIHYVEEVSFRSDAMSPVAQRAPWYAGLIDNTSFSAVNAADTAASHAGWIESDDYDEGARQVLAFAAAAARAITATVEFTMSTTKTIRGIFIDDEDTFLATTGLLFSTALFPTAQTVVDGNVLTGNYSLSD